MKRVLVCAVGMSPQVVTETLWVLNRRGHMPNDLVIVTTEAGRAEAEEALLRPAQGALWRFCLDFGVDRPSVRFEVPRDDAGAAISDITDTRTATHMADLFVRVVEELTRDPATAVHASIAGGRKTMSYQLGYALTLFGRPQDSLSHVLVQPSAFEQLREFFYPPPLPVDLLDREGTIHRTSDARIELADIPFLRTRDYLPKRFRHPTDPVSHAAITEEVQACLEQALLVFVDDGRTIRIGRRDVSLSSKAYALYHLYAEAAAERWPGAGPEGFGAERAGWISAADFDSENSRAITRFLELWRDHPDVNPDELAEAQRVIETHTPDMGKLSERLRVDFPPLRSRINKKIEAAVGASELAGLFKIADRRSKDGQRGVATCNGLHADPSRIALNAAGQSGNV